MPNEKDIAEKFLEAKNDVFADIVNVLLFNGREIVREDELEPSLPRSQFKSDGGLHEQERDVAKLWRNGKICIALYGMENQTKPDPKMPLRVISYDGASYKEQVIQCSQKEKAGEKADPFYPVVTLILYFGKAHWNHPRTLLDSLGENIPTELRSYVSDYKINVFEIAHLTREQVSLFKSDFRIVADYFVQMAQNEEYIPSAAEIKHVDELFKLLSALTGDHRFEDTYNEEHHQKGAPITMIDVFSEYEKRGLARGRAEGRTEGRAEGRAEGTLLTLCRLVKRGLLSPTVAAEDAGMSVEDFLAKMEQAYPG